MAAVAQEAVETQNDILVTGDIEGALMRKPKAASYRAAIEKHFVTLVGRKATLRAFLARYFSELIRGEVIQADFAPVDGVIDHTMIVTYKDSDGRPLPDVPLEQHGGQAAGRPTRELPRR